MKKTLLLVIMLTIPMFAFSQTKFRSGIFLHHSTGDNIWGPNRSNTSIPKEITRYNNEKGYTGGNAVSMNHLWWPDGTNSGNNEWEYWHTIFENKDVAHSDIRPILSQNKIVVIKSCFPSSAIDSYGVPSDTLRPGRKTIYNYKWHWRHIVRAMEKYPDNFFVIWTNAPMTSGQSDQNSANLSRRFTKWATDTLAQGLDPVIGSFPKNIYIFDFFGKLTDNNGYLIMDYAEGRYDSHPNAAATALIAPQFVNEIFDAAINYESIASGIQPPESHFDIQLYPNPAQDNITLTISEPGENVSLSLYNIAGMELLRQPLTDYNTIIKLAGLSSGMYVCKISNGVRTEARKIIKNNN